MKEQKATAQSKTKEQSSAIKSDGRELDLPQVRESEEAASKQELQHGKEIEAQAIKGPDPGPEEHVVKGKGKKAAGKIEGEGEDLAGDVEGNNQEVEDQSIEGQEIRLQFINGGVVKVVLDDWEVESPGSEAPEINDQTQAVDQVVAVKAGVEDHDQAQAIEGLEVKESGAGSGPEVVAGVEARVIATAEPVKGKDLAEAVPNDKQAPVLGGAGKEKPMKIDEGKHVNKAANKAENVLSACQVSIKESPKKNEAVLTFGCGCKKKNLQEFLRLIQRVASHTDVDLVEEAEKPGKKPARGDRVELGEGAGRRKGFGRIW